MKIRANRKAGSLLVAVVTSVCCFGQAENVKERLPDSDYLTHCLTILSNPAFDGRFVELSERAMIRQLGLDTEEIRMIRAASHELRQLWDANRQAATRITSGGKELAPNDYADITALSDDFEAAVTQRVHAILRTVRPDVAARVRALSIVGARPPARRMAHEVPAASGK